MTTPPSDDGTSPVEWIERWAGVCTGAEPPTVRGVDRGYAIAFFDLPDEDMATAASSGLRWSDLPAIAPSELVCTVRRDQREAARVLVDLAARKSIQAGRGLEWGTPADNGQPVLTGTAIHGVMCTTHPYFSDEFNAIFDERRSMVVRFITLVPATGPELALAVARGQDALWDCWIDQATDLLDVTRPSAV